jgi:PAS domain S-box-containing protein
MIFIDFIYNLALLVSLSIVSGFVDKRFSRHTKAGLIIQGLLFGVVSIIGMIHPIVFSEGIMFDGRSVVLSLATLFFGPVSGVIAGVMAFAFRLYQGGSGVLPGSLVILFSVLMGTIYYEYRKVVNKKITVFHLLYFGIIVHIVMLLAMFSLPFPTAISVIKQIGIPVIFLFPLATVLIGKILSDQQVNIEVSKIIQEGEEKYKTLLNHLSDAVWVISSEGKIISANPAFETITGWPVSEYIYNRYDDLIHQDDLHIVKENITKILNGTGVNVFEIRIVSKSGKNKVVEINPSLLRIGSKSIGALCIIRDITDRRKAEEKLLEEQFLMNTLMNNIPDHIYFKDKNSRYTRISKEQVISYGISDPSLVLGKTDFDFFDEEHARAAFEDEKTIIQTGKPIVGIEEKEIMPDGQIKWVSTTKMPLRDKDGNIIGTFGISRDITDRKLAEETLKLNENFLKETQRIAKLGSYVLDIKKGTWSSSEILNSILGIDPDYDKSVEGWGSLIHPDWQKLMLDYFTNEVITLRKNFDKIYKIIRKNDNAERWVHGLGELIVDKQNNPIKMIGTIRDITERKIAEEKLIKSEDEFRDLFENSSDLICTHDLDGKVLIVNKASEILTGYSRNELLNMKIQDLLMPRLKNQFDRYLTEIKSNGKASGTMIIQNKSGEKRYWLFNNSLRSEGVEKPIVRGIAKDITESKLAEEELRKSRDELKDYFENDISADYVTTMDGKIIDCNKTFMTMFGIKDKKELEEINIANYFKYPESREKLIKAVEKNKRVNNYEVDFILPNQKEISVILMMVGVFGESGKLQKIRGYLVDITEKKQAEEGFRKLSLAVDQSPVSVIITSPQGEIEYVNERFCEVTGYTREDALGQNPRILKSGLQDREFYGELWSTILAGEVWKGELQNKKKNGELYWEAALISPLVNSEGTVTSFIAVKEDITKRKREQEELLKAKEKAEEMNRLKNNFLSNMSHELRTPLIGILGYAEFLAGELKDKELIEMANVIKNSGKRLNQTLNNILDISKIESDKQKIDIEKFDLLRLLDEQIKLFKPVAENKELELMLETAEEKLEAYVDEELFVSIITNLLSNALKYTVKGSVIIAARKKEKYAVVEVKDTGIGIAEEFHEIIFEPFRQASEGLNRKYEGTGLGLALVKKYMSLIGGTISLKSEPNEGSIFTLKFLVTEPVKEKIISTKW